MATPSGGTKDIASSNRSKDLRIFLFSQPRTASNLFLKLYSEHPDILQHVYPYLYPHFYSQEAQAAGNGGLQISDVQKAQKEATKDITYQNALDKLQQRIATTEAAVRLI